MNVILVNTAFSNSDVNYVNIFNKITQQNFLTEIITKDNSQIIDVAANIINTTEMILNIDEEDLVKKFNYVILQDHIFFEKRITYWFVESIDRAKHYKKPRVKIVLDSITSFGDVIHKALLNKIVFLERAHFDRWRIDPPDRIVPNIDNESRWYYKPEFNDEITETAEQTIDDFDEYLTPDINASEKLNRKLAWGVYNLGSPNINNDEIIISADISTGSDVKFGTTDGIIVPIILGTEKTNYNHFTHFLDGTLTALYTSPVLFRATAPESNKDEAGGEPKSTIHYGTVDISGKKFNALVKSYKNVKVGTQEGFSRDAYINLFNTEHMVLNHAQGRIAYDKRDEFLKWRWQNELKIINNRNFRTVIGFTGIEEEWELNIEYLLINYKKIFKDLFEPTRLLTYFYLKLTSETGIIDSRIAATPEHNKLDSNLIFTYTLNQLPIFTDQYQEYLRLNQSTISTAKHQAEENRKWGIAQGALGIFSGVSKIAAGGFAATSAAGQAAAKSSGVPSSIIGGGIAASGGGNILSGIKSLATANFERDKLQAQLNDKTRLNSKKSNTSLHYLNNIIGIANYDKTSYVKYYKQQTGILKEKARYHQKWGYEISGNVKYTEELFGRYIFNFIQINDASALLNDTNLEKDILDLIDLKLEVGVRLWNKIEDINNYEKENWEQTIIDWIT